MSQLIRISDCEKVEIKVPVGGLVNIGKYTAICRKTDPVLEPGDKCLKCELSGGEIGGCESKFEHVSLLCGSNEREDGKNVFFEKVVGSVE